MASATTTPLRLSLIPGVAVGGIIGSIIITNVVTRISQRNERTSLFVKRRARRRCPRCGGFGVVRCNLCQGEAMVFCRGRFIQQIPCPMCVMRRHVPCRMCSGSGIRPSQDGLVPRVDVFMLSILRMFDEVRAALWVPFTCIYMTRTQQLKRFPRSLPTIMFNEI